MCKASTQPSQPPPGEVGRLPHTDLERFLERFLERVEKTRFLERYLERFLERFLERSPGEVPGEVSWRGFGALQPHVD